MSCMIHTNSLVTNVKTLYSASAEDLETIACFLDFQESIESPRNIQNPVTNLLVSRHDPQSISAKTFR